MKKIRNMRKRTGFTLVELLIVIIIIGILAGSMMLVAGSGTDRAEATKIISDMRSLKAAALMYYADENKWPVQSDDVSALKDYMDRTPTGYSFISADKLYVGRNVTNSGVLGALANSAQDAGLYVQGDTPPVILVSTDVAPKTVMMRVN